MEKKMRVLPNKRRDKMKSHKCDVAYGESSGLKKEEKKEESSAFIALWTHVNMTI